MLKSLRIYQNEIFMVLNLRLKQKVLNYLYKKNTYKTHIHPQQVRRISVKAGAVISNRPSITAASRRLDPDEQYERQDNLIMSGLNLPVVARSKNCKEIVRSLFRQHLKLSVCFTDILITHRLGEHRQNIAGKRNIIFKLSRSDFPTEIILGCKQLKSQPSLPFFVKKLLAPPRFKKFPWSPVISCFTSCL